jgi:hypothetical protein
MKASGLQDEHVSSNIIKELITDYIGKGCTLVADDYCNN